MRSDPLPSHLARMPFTTRAGYEAGLTDWRLAGDEFLRPFHGIRLTPSTAQHLELAPLVAYLSAERGRIALSHTSAARAFDVPLPRACPILPIHVSVPCPRRARRGRNVIGHTIAADRWSTVELAAIDRQTGVAAHLPVLAPELVWLGLSELMPWWELVVAADHLVSTGRTSRALLLEAAAHGLGRRGAVALREAAPLIRGRTRSRPETLLRLLIVAAGLPEPEINAIVRAADGVVLCEADLVWREYRTLTEYEGDWHRTDRAKFRSDILRFERYRDSGWDALRVTADDIREPMPFLTRLRGRLVAHGWSPTREMPHIRGFEP